MHRLSISSYFDFLFSDCCFFGRPAVYFPVESGEFRSRMPSGYGFRRGHGFPFAVQRLPARFVLKKNIIESNDILPCQGKELGSTRSATVSGVKLEYRDHYHLPLFPAFVDHGVYTSGNWYEHISYRLVAFEIPLEGNMQFRQRDVLSVVNPGTVYLMHRGENSRLESGPSGVCRKLALCLGGSSLRQIMADLGLSNRLAVPVGNLNRLVELILQIERAVSAKEVFPACALAYEFLLELASNIESRLPEPLSQIIESMNIGIPQNLTLEDFAEEFHISRSTLNRLFKQHLNTTPKEYYRNLKLEFSRRLLHDTHYPVKQIAERSGFPDPVRFSHAFRSAFHCSPAQYRNSLKETKKQ